MGAYSFADVGGFLGPEGVWIRVGDTVFQGTPFGTEAVTVRRASADCHGQVMVSVDRANGGWDTSFPSRLYQTPEAADPRRRKSACSCGHAYGEVVTRMDRCDACRGDR